MKLIQYVFVTIAASACWFGGGVMPSVNAAPPTLVRPLPRVIEVRQSADPSPPQRDPQRSAPFRLVGHRVATATAAINVVEHHRDGRKPEVEEIQVQWIDPSPGDLPTVFSADDIVRANEIRSGRRSIALPFTPASGTKITINPPTFASDTDVGPAVDAARDLVTSSAGTASLALDPPVGEAAAAESIADERSSPRTKTQDLRARTQSSIATSTQPFDSSPDQSAAIMDMRPTATQPTATQPTATRPAATRSVAPTDISDAMFRIGDVTFRNTDVGEVVFVLSDRWNINIVASDDVEGEVSGTFRNTPLWEVLDSLLLSTGYGYQRVGQSLVILSADEVDPSQGFTRGRPNLQPDGTPSFGEVSSGVRSQVNASVPVSAAAGLTAGGSEVAFFTLQYTEAEMLSKPLIEAFESTSAKIAVYPEENRLMVLGTASEIATATNMIEQLDRPRAQVRITAMIYDVELGEIRNIGLNLARDARGITELANPGLSGQEGNLGSFFAASSNLLTGDTSVGLRTIRDSQTTSALLECLNSNSESKLLADPSITVGDRHDASIRIVQRIPIITANPLEGSTAVFTQTQFEEAGVILNVMPRISRDGTIELTVKPEYSVVTEILSTGPVIDSRTAETTVRVADGEMFVLGGLRQKTIVETVRGIPGLKDIKYVGRLFQGHSTELRESELIVFLRPEIVRQCQCVDPRQMQAYRIGNEYLDRIPYAETIPLTPCCHDPHCPNHHPRPRTNPGSGGLIDGDW